MHRVRFFRDDCDTNDPRGWDNVGTIAVWHTRYALGDVRPKEHPDDWRAALPEGTLTLPLYLLDHSGIALSVHPFNDVWDSGQIGYIIATPEAVEKFGVKPQDLQACLRSEVEVYNQYLSGDVCGYSIEVADTCGACDHTEWEEVDGCGGFIGATLETMLGEIAPEYHEAAREAWKKFA